MKFEPKGVIPAMVTPFKDDYEFDEEGFRSNVDFVIENGVHGIFVAGGQGEFWSLSKDEKKRLFQVAVEDVDRRVSVYVGTGAESTGEAVELTKIAEDMGADAAIVITPYYIRPSSRELFHHYTEVAGSVDIPIIVYNNPPRTGGININPELLLECVEECSNIVGIKDSSGDLTRTLEYIRICGHKLSVLAGRDTLIYSTIAAGGKGAIASCANVVPELVLEIYESLMKGDHRKALDAQFRLAPLRIAFELGSFPVVIKEALNLIGRAAGPARMPILPMESGKREMLKRILRSYGFNLH